MMALAILIPYSSFWLRRAKNTEICTFATNKGTQETDIIMLSILNSDLSKCCYCVVTTLH